jgi:hypothetical protein
MTFRVQYASRQREIWAWYWRAWRQRLWKSHLLIFLIAAVTTGLCVQGNNQLSPMSILLGLVGGLVSVLFLLMYPQLMFKPQVRTLEVSQRGISTTIGRRSARRSWTEVQSVSEDEGNIIILGRNGNAFVVPPRAFASTDERQRFLSFAHSAVEASVSTSRQ